MTDLETLEEKLYLCAQKGYTVLLSGLRGVGKTSLIVNTFNKMGWNYVVLNSALLNPYRDISGISFKSSTINKYTNQEIMCTDVMLPKMMASDNLDAIFFDEISRANRETMNGLFQLIQNKSINGFQLHNLKVIWGAYNPYNPDLDADEQIYHVNQLDPAFQDRFKIQISLPYELNKPYLLNKHGAVAQPFIDWWYNLPMELRLECSPRRLEDGIEVFKDGLWLEDVFYHEKLTPMLVSLYDNIALAENSNKGRLFIDSLKKKNIDEAKAVIGIENVELVLDAIKQKQLSSTYLKAINRDVLAQHLSKQEDLKLETIVVDLLNKDEDFKLSEFGHQVVFGKQILMKESLLNGLKNILNKFESGGYSNSNDLMGDFSFDFINVIHQYVIKGRQTKILRSDLSLMDFYNKLKSDEVFVGLFKQMYRACVQLWYGWQSGSTSKLDKSRQQNELIAQHKNELSAMITGFFFKQLVMDKEFKVFKNFKCQDTAEFDSVTEIPELSTVMGKTKGFFFGTSKSNKQVSKILEQLFENNPSPVELQSRISLYKF